jgi:hypothetical protein
VRSAVSVLTDDLCSRWPLKRGRGDLTVRRIAKEGVMADLLFLPFKILGFLVFLPFRILGFVVFLPLKLLFFVLSLILMVILIPVAIVCIPLMLLALPVMLFFGLCKFAWHA